MPIVGPTFFSSPAGDHPAGDGLTLFQTIFAGGSTADVSSFAIGPASITGPSYITASDGNLNITQTSSNVSTAAWSNGSFNIASSASDWCLEMFIRLTPTPSHPALTQKFAQVTMGALSFDLVMAPESPAGVNLMYAAFAGPSYQYSPGNVTNDGLFHHIAIISRPPGPNMMDGYVDGQRIFTSRYWAASGPSGYIQLGATGNSGYSVSIDIAGVRVRGAQMYPSGASFTPPASPAAWGPP